MPRFTILPTDRSCSSAEITAPDASGILPLIDRLNCKEADVVQDGVYAFSARIGGNGLWMIFQRQADSDTGDIPAFE